MTRCSTPTFGDLADACFLLAYVALTVALLRLVRSRGRDVPALLDALVVTIGLGVVSWQFLMVPYARDPSLSLDQKLTSIVLPLADVVLLAVLVRLWSGGGQRPTTYWLLGVSVVALLAADTAFGVVTLRGPFLSGVLPALAGTGRVLVDLRAHRTIHDAAEIARGRGAQVRRFRPNDVEHAGRLLRASARGPRILCMDGINSMTGNPPDLPAFAAWPGSTTPCCTSTTPTGSGSSGSGQPRPHPLRASRQCNRSLVR